MAIGAVYATLAEFKDYLKIDAAKTSYDAAMMAALASASTEIEDHTDRQFNKDTSATARLYEPLSWGTTRVEDFWTTSGLVIESDPGGIGDYSTVWTSADYELRPLNGIVKGRPGWPYTRIVATGVNGLFFPKFDTRYTTFRRKAVVRVTAQWGWTAVPAPVHQACLIIAAETFRLKDAPLGVAGLDSIGAVVRVRQNMHANRMLQQYVRSSVLVG